MYVMSFGNEGMVIDDSMTIMVSIQFRSDGHPGILSTEKSLLLLVTLQ